MDLEKFEQFKKTGAKLSNYSISINNALSFGFNSGFYNKNNIKGYIYVVLFYNKKDNSVAFFFTNNEADGRFRITHSKNKTSGNRAPKTRFHSADPYHPCRNDAPKSVNGRVK